MKTAGLGEHFGPHGHDPVDGLRNPLLGDARPFAIDYLCLPDLFLVGETTESDYSHRITLLIAAPTLFRGYLKHRKFQGARDLSSSVLLFLALRPGAFHHDHVHEGEVFAFRICRFGRFFIGHRPLD